MWFINVQYQRHPILVFYKKKEREEKNEREKGEEDKRINVKT